MNHLELKTLIKQGESDTLEFKKSTSLLESVSQTLCGFLNGKGGIVLIGVSDEGKMIGQHVTDNTLQEIARSLGKFEPPPQIELFRLPVGENKEIIILKAILRKCTIPYTWDGRPYQRVTSTTSRIPQGIYQTLLMERDQNNHRWETGIALHYPESDLDADEIFRTLRLGAEALRLPPHQGDELPLIFDKLGLRKNGQLLNAAVVLFGKKFSPSFPQCHLRLACFKGLDKSEFLDQNQLTGNAFYLLEEAFLFLRRHLPVAAKVEPHTLERKEEPLFPFEALREALVNAFCHRSYSHPGGAVSLALFKDRLEIWNDDKLPFGLKTADLKKDHVSVPRNPLIAHVFYYRGLIERWGRGTQRIVDLCIKAGHPEPQFLEQANSFATYFLASNYTPPHRISHNLTDRTLRDDFQHLKRLKLILVKGHGRGAKWHLTLKAE